MPHEATTITFHNRSATYVTDRSPKGDGMTEIETSPSTSSLGRSS